MSNEQAGEVLAALEAMPDEWATSDDYGEVRFWLRNAGLRAPGDNEELLEHRRDLLAPFPGGFVEWRTHRHKRLREAGWTQRLDGQWDRPEPGGDTKHQ